jgi:hypothetical protein
MTQAREFVNGPRRDRTCDPLIKSLRGARPARAKRHAFVGNSAETLAAAVCRPARAGPEPHRLASSWLQDGCRILADTGR